MLDLILHFFVKPVMAAADPALVNAAGDLATTAKENVTGAVLSTTVMTAIGVIFITIAVVFLIIRLMKRSAK